MSSGNDTGLLLSGRYDMGTIILALLVMFMVALAVSSLTRKEEPRVILVQVPVDERRHDGGRWALLPFLFVGLYVLYSFGLI
jgi:hypothetical protein